MVDEIVTRQELIDAKRDAHDLGKAVNEKVIVSPRYGEDFKSLPMISAEGQAAISTFESNGQSSINSFDATAQSTINEWESAIALITQEGGVPALAVSDASGETQQTINLKGAPTWYARPGGYSAGDTVRLANGDIVKSTVAGNTVDPNVDMTGWVLVNSDSAITTWSGRTQEEKNKESLSPYDFGAIGNGVTDDTEALKLYAAYCSMYGNKMMLGRGTYRITDTIPGSGFLIHGEKGFCKVIADNMEGKGIFDLTVPVSVFGRSVGSVDVEYEARGANISYAVATPENSSQYSLYYLTSFFTGNYCHGGNRIVEKYSFAWDYSAESWFKIGDCVGALFEKNNIQGSFDIQQDPLTQFHDVGVTTKANGAVMSLRMSNNNIGPIYRAVVIGDKTFATIHDNDLIGTYDSIVWEGTNLFNESKVYSNNMNAQRFGVYVKGPGSLAFKDNTIRRHSRGWKGATHNWYGFYLENISELKLAQNTVQPDQSGGAFSGDSHAYYLKECDLAGVSGNFVGVGNAKGITLDNCTGLNVTDTITAQNATSDILFNLVNNTRLTNIGSYQLVSSFNGKVLAKDATITNAITMLNQQEDIQSSSDIVQDITRTSSAANSKKWRQTVSSNTLVRRVVSDAGANTNYEIITRNGTTVETIEWRAGKFKFNNGPEIFTGTGSPEGLVTAPKGSMYLRTDSSSTETLYIKQSGVGNTGWVAK